MLPHPLTTSPWTVRGNLPEDRFIIQSHRGAGDLAPENTPESFQLAWSLDIWPESDLRTTKDGVIVTFHDPDFSRVVRTTDPSLKSKSVPDLTWPELAQLDVGAYKGPQFHNRRVPTLADAFTALAAHPTRHLYLDVKNVDLPQLAQLVKTHRVEKQVVLASPDYPDHRTWKQLAPQSDTLLWMGGTEDHLKARLADLRKTNFADLTQLQIHVHLKDPLDLAHPDPFTPTDQFLIDTGAELRAHHITFQCLPWHAADPNVYHKLLDLGVMSFATDRPDVTRQAVHDYYTHP